MAVEEYYARVRKHLEETSIWARWRLHPKRKEAILREAVERVVRLIVENWGFDRLDWFDWESEFEKIIDYETADDFVRELMERYGWMPPIEEQIAREVDERLKVAYELLSEIKEMDPERLREVLHWLSDQINYEDRLYRALREAEEWKKRYFSLLAKYRRDKARMRELEEANRRLRETEREAEEGARRIREEIRKAKVVEKGLTEADWRRLEDRYRSEVARLTGRMRVPMYFFRDWRARMEPELAKKPREEALREAEEALEALISEVISILERGEKRRPPRRAAAPPPEEVVEVAPEELMAMRDMLRVMAPHLVRYFPPWMGVRRMIERVPEDILAKPIVPEEYELFKEWLRKKEEREKWVLRKANPEVRERLLREIREAHRRWLENPEIVPEQVRITFRQEVWSRPIERDERGEFEEWLMRLGLTMADYMLMPEEQRKTLRMWFRAMKFGLA